MREAFRQHHKPSAAEQTALWQAATFALDTNVLLNVYRYADATREDLFRVLGALSSKIWVPFQVAREFYRNRLEVIQEQSDKYGELESTLQKFLTTIRGSFHRSAFLRIADVEGQLRPAIETATQLIQERKKLHPDLLHDDTYLERLAALVGSSLGTEPDSTTLDKRHSDAQARIDRLVPPGYRDAKKPPPDRYGDVLIWFELLDLAQANKKPIIFVTDDDKEDWWQIVRGEKLGPRPELREEMRRCANVEFHIYTAARFLETAGKDLDVGIAKSSIDDASRIAAELRQEQLRLPVTSPEDAGVDALRDRSHTASKEAFLGQVRAADVAVGRWLKDEYPNCELSASERGPFDYLIRRDEKTIAVETRLLRPPLSPIMRTRIRDACIRAFYEISRGTVSDYLLALVATDPQTAMDYSALISERAHDGPEYPLVIGFLDRHRRFQPVVWRGEKP